MMAMLRMLGALAPLTLLLAAPASASEAARPATGTICINRFGLDGANPCPERAPDDAGDRTWSFLVQVATSSP